MDKAVAPTPSLLPHRPNVGIALFNASGLVFAGMALNEGPEQVEPGFEWQMPQGGIDAGEDPLAAARRELQEETGVTSVELLGETADWYSYDLPVDISRKAWKGRYRAPAETPRYKLRPRTKIRSRRYSARWDS